MRSISDLIIYCPICQTQLRYMGFALACPYHGYGLFTRTDSDNQQEKKPEDEISQGLLEHQESCINDDI